MKFGMLFPPCTVVKNFLGQEEFAQAKAWFEKELSHLAYKKDLVGTGHLNCHLKEEKYEGLKAPFFKQKFEKAYLQLCQRSLPGATPPTLKFNTIYAKFYDNGDFYAKHLDLSTSGLTFLYQFTLNSDAPQFPPLKFENGQEVAFENNQLLIFHSFEMHSFVPDKQVTPGGKCIIQCLPDL